MRILGKAIRTYVEAWWAVPNKVPPIKHQPAATTALHPRLQPA
jgi:hypothetical protein